MSSDAALSNLAIMSDKALLPVSPSAASAAAADGSLSSHCSLFLRFFCGVSKYVKRVVNIS